MLDSVADTVTMMIVHVLLTLVALSSAKPASALAQTLARLPADAPVTDGTVVNSICGTCCQDGTYCGSVPEDILLASSTRPASGLLVPMGTNMTCMLRARNVFGAVDGGLCVPSLLPQQFPIKTLCRSLDQVHLMILLALLTEPIAELALTSTTAAGAESVSHSY